MLLQCILVLLLLSSHALGQSISAVRFAERRGSNRVLRFVPSHERLSQNGRSQNDSTLDAYAGPALVTDEVVSTLHRSADQDAVRAVQSNPVAGPIAVASASSVMPGLADESSMVQLGSFEAESLITEGWSYDTITTESLGSMAWGRAEYLYWRTNGVDAPAFVTSSPSGTSQAEAGVLGQSGTTTLFGGNDLLNANRSGVEIMLGTFVSPASGLSIEFTYTRLDDETARFSAAGGDIAILARPFLNVSNGREDSRIIELAGFSSGSIDIELRSQYQSAQVMLRQPGFHGTGAQFMIGYRFAELDDGVNITESTTSLASPTLGTRIALSDRFGTGNEFHGGQLGIQFAGPSGGFWTSDLFAKVAVGNTNRHAVIRGSTTTTSSTGDSTSRDSGLLVLDSNRGVFESNDIGTITELGLLLRRHWACGLSFSIGYRFLNWGDVIRATDQIDRRINPTQIVPDTLVGRSLPVFPLDSGSYWAHGLNLGLDFCF